MTNKRKMAAQALALAALAGTLTVVAPQVASASDFLNSCDLTTKIDELRGWGSDNSANIIVYKASAMQSGYFNDIVAQGSAKQLPCHVKFGPKDYHWVVFKGDGEFVRKGDGGVRNWAFFGSFQRDGDTKVRFNRR